MTAQAAVTETERSSHQGVSGRGGDARGELAGLPRGTERRAVPVRTAQLVTAASAAWKG